MGYILLCHVEIRIYPGLGADATDFVLWIMLSGSIHLIVSNLTHHYPVIEGFIFRAGGVEIHLLQETPTRLPDSGRAGDGHLVLYDILLPSAQGFF